MNDENVEARLARWGLAAPPSELMRRLHAAAPPARAERRPGQRVGEWLGGSPWRPWPLAYAGMLAAWILILALRLLTPADPESAAPASLAHADAASPDAPAFAGMLAAERTFFLAHNNPDPL